MEDYTFTDDGTMVCPYCGHIDDTHLDDAEKNESYTCRKCGKLSYVEVVKTFMLSPADEED